MPLVTSFRAGVLALLGLAVGASAAETSAVDVQALVEQNRRLEAQLRAQQATIDELAAKMAEMQRTADRQQKDLQGVQDRLDGGSATAGASDRQHEVHVGAETGLAFFQTGSDGQFPKSEFRVDDPVVTIEAPVWKDVYFYTELKLLTREASNENFQLGELYVDFEDVLGRWGHGGLLSFRAGRINIPFGEEYQSRYPVENPLISHSLSDIWGCDEGMEIYGRIGPARYVVAVQNGGISRLHDFNADKAVVARVGWDPANWLHLSASAMRTGELATTADNLSEVWFANGFFRSIAPAGRSTAFWADLFEGDAVGRWKSGHVAAAWGGARYDDNDRLADHARTIRYGYVEAVQNVTASLYGAARYSLIRAPSGYPMVGGGTAGEYFFQPSLTEELRRLSVGLGYRFAAPLVWKIEYSWNSGRLLGGQPRDGEDFFGSEIGLKF